MESHKSPIKDAKRIDVDDAAELEAWCTLLKLEPEDLRTAVNIIGPMSAAVAVYVNSRGRRGAFRQVGEIGHPFRRRDEPATGRDAARRQPVDAIGRRSDQIGSLGRTQVRRCDVERRDR